MSETLESAGFSRPKSHAAIKSVALATFADTPERLDDRLGRLESRIDWLQEGMCALFARLSRKIKAQFSAQHDEINAQLDAQREEIKALRASQAEDMKGLRQSVIRIEQNVNQLSISVDELKQNLLEHHDKVVAFHFTVIDYMLTFTAFLFGAAAGLRVAIAAQQFL